jgi:hypothetical protein
MEFALREDHRWHRPSETAQIGFGDIDLLLEFLKDQDDVGIMAVIGAEMVDSKGRFVQIANVHPELQRLRDELNASKRNPRIELRSVIVAESYKLSSTLEDAGLYRDHLDQIILAPPGVADLLVTDADAIPLNTAESTLPR